MIKKLHLTFVSLFASSDTLENSWILLSAVIRNLSKSSKGNIMNHLKEKFKTSRLEIQIKQTMIDVVSIESMVSRLQY